MKNLFTLFLALFSFVSTAQDYYWVGGSGNWSDFATHWATTTGGNTFHTSAPTSSNDVYFDANSFDSSGQIITLDVEANCLSMDWTGTTNFPSITSDGIDLNIYGSLLMATDMTADFSDVEFESGSAGNTITSNGVSLGAKSTTRFNGIGGEWILQDNFQTNNLYLVAGTFSTNNHRVDAGARFITSGSDIKVINLGASEIIAERWWVQGTNQTINGGTSTIVASSFYGDTNGDGPYTYYDVVFENYGVLRNTSSFNKITIPAGLSLRLESGSTFTVNEIQANGNKHSFIEVKAETEGVPTVISQLSGAVDWTYVKLQDVTATGGADFTVTNAIDNGNNTGWTISEIVGQDYYWVGNGGDWSDFTNHWATTSGGSTMHTDYPNSFDNVYFDANSFTIESQTVSQDIEGGTTLGSMDWTGVLNNPTLSSSYSYNLKAHGSVTFIDEMTRNLYGFDLQGNELGQVFDMSGSGNITFLSIQGEGEYDLLSDINVAVFTHRNGTINYNGVSIDCSIDFDLGHNDLVANFGSTSITCRDFTYNSSSSTITGTPSISVERNFEGNGIEIYEVILSGSGNVLGSNTFENLEIKPGVNTTFDAGETQTINQTLTLAGTKSSPISLSSDDSGIQSSISVAAGTIDAIYLTLQDINATGGATFNATQTLDNGNNTGWNITGLTSLDYYWVGDGGSWSDFTNHWATSSGGSTMHTDGPGVLDRVFFDANSFSLANQTVLVDGNDISFHDMSWSGVTNSPIFNSDGNGLNVYGSMEFDPSVAITLNDVYFVSTEAETISLQDEEPGTSAYFYFIGSGSWTFNSGFTVRELHQHSGNIDMNGNKVVVDFRTDFFGDDAKSMTLGASDFFTRTFSIGSANNLTFDGSLSSISSSSSFSILGGTGNTYTFNDFKFILYNSTDEGILNADMTVNKLTFDPNTIIELRAGITITTNELVAVGTAENPIAIVSQSTGNSATISQSTGTVDAYYLELQDITVTGGATFNAFSSVDNGNVSGWTFNRLSQTIDFADISDMPLDAPNFDLVATSSSGLPVAFEIISGNVELVGDGSTVSILGGGPVSIQAKQDGDIDYDPAPSITKMFTVTKLDQVIVFESIPAKKTIDADFELVATGGDSGNPIVFVSSDASVATISGTTVSIHGEGTTTITASQAGDNDYEAAAEVEQILVVTKIGQEIFFESIPAKTTIDADFELVATGGDSGNPIVFVSSDASVATISGTTVSIHGEGTTTITASQAGDNDYEAAAEVEQILVVTKIGQEIVFEAIPAKTTIDADFELVATGGDSGNPITFVSSNASVATISGTTVSIVGAGTATITASQAGNNDYEAAADVEQILVVTKISQEIVFESIPAKTTIDTDFELVVTGGDSGNPITFVSTDESVATISGTTVSILGSGTTTITASQAGNNDYEAAADVEQILVVTKISQEIVFEAIPAKTTIDADFELVATGGNSGNPITFVSSDASVATISGTSVLIVGAGTATITASQAGNNDYEAAADVEQILVVTKISQEIVFESIPAKTTIDTDFELVVTGGDSGNPITFVSTDESVATISGTTVSILGAGTTTITASQAGNNDYEAAADVDQTLVVTKISQEIVFEAIADKELSDTAFELVASGGASGNPIVFTSSDLSVVTISETTANLVGKGAVTITASQAGNDDYEPAVDVEQSFTVIDRSQTISFGQLDDVFYGDADFNLSATASSDLVVTYISSDESVAQVNGSLVTIISIGTTTITASQIGNEEFDPAENVMQDLVVSPAILSVIAEDQTKIYGDANPTLTVIYDGFVNGEDETVLNTEPTIDTEANALAEVGEHSITIQGGSADNYELNRIEGTLEVTKRDLVAIADDQFMRVGDLVPELTISYDGLVNEDRGSDIDLPPAISTTASSASTIGEYTITLSGGEDNNYLIVTRVEGTMTVDRALGLDINDVEGISFFPNPASDFVIIKSNGTHQKLEIRSMEGRLLNTYSIQKQKRIDLHQFSKGLYLLILKEEEDTIGISHLIVE